MMFYGYGSGKSYGSCRIWISNAVKMRTWHVDVEPCHMGYTSFTCLQPAVNLLFCKRRTVTTTPRNEKAEYL